MKITLAATGRISLLVATAAFGVAVAGAPAAAFGGSTVNKANLAITGGDATAVGACLNYAKVYAKFKKPAPKLQTCQNISAAQGGGVTLKDVDVVVAQTAAGKKKAYQSADITIAGGNATAMSACANVLNGTATSKNYQDCSTISDAKGGDVVLKDVTLTVVQEG